MKITKIAFAITLFFAFGCNEQLKTEKTSDLADHNMKIIPSNPTSTDEIKLVIYNDCTYNTLSDMQINENTIDIYKQFNSLMKWPCTESNDTILIGKLAEGTYWANYKLLDIASPATPQITISLTFNLIVSE
jgi:hypothetical protein